MMTKPMDPRPRRRFRLYERINVYTAMLWLAVFGVAVARSPRHAG